MALIDYIFYRVAVGVTSMVCAGHWWHMHVSSWHYVSGPSMLPTFPAFDSIGVVRPQHRYGRGITVGDVVMAKHPFYGEKVLIGKRVIGMPGDYVVLDGPGSSDANVAGLGLQKNGVLGAETRGMMVQVPEGHCWLAGDNLPWSRDSRFYGPIPLALIKGRVVGSLMRSGTFSIYKWKKATNNMEEVDLEDVMDEEVAPNVDTKGMSHVVVELKGNSGK